MMEASIVPAPASSVTMSWGMLAPESCSLRSLPV
jgi:hypothetical protein